MRLCNRCLSWDCECTQDLKRGRFIVQKPKSHDPTFPLWSRADHDGFQKHIFKWKNLDIADTDDLNWIIIHPYEMTPIHIKWINIVDESFHFCVCPHWDVINYGCKCGGK